MASTVVVGRSGVVEDTAGEGVGIDVVEVVVVDDDFGGKPGKVV